MKLLIIDNYDSFTYNLVQLVEQAGIQDYQLVKNDQLLSLNPLKYDKVLVSPGPGIASEAGELLPFLHNIINQKPILGICLGYEALVELSGGKLKQLENPLHGIQNKGKLIQPHPLFHEIPPSFNIGHYHSWIADEQTLSVETQTLMRDENGLNMAIAHTQQPWVGLLFHPESIMTEFGLRMLKNWINL